MWRRSAAYIKILSVNEINIRIVQKYLITTVYIEDKQSPFHPKILYHYSIKNELNSAVNKALAIIIINC